MKYTPDQREILGLEGEYWQAMKKNDVEAAVELTHFPCLIASPEGVRKVDESTYRRMMEKHGAGVFQDIEIENAQIELLNGTTAMITYTIQVNGMTMVDVSTWVRENGKWQCAFHSENPKLQ